tara:strand:+ start:13233 stop:14300 length:1068 start_codon:yes stop_codon:yes gene_type:complete
MANKSVYQNFETDALNHFDLASAPLYGVVAGSGASSKIENVLVTQDVTTYEKIKRLLSVPNESDLTFKTKKKAFILPKCNVSQDRLKAALKEHDITLTNDYELADLIVGHDSISEDYSNGENILSTLMLAKLWNYELTSDPGKTGATWIADLINNHSESVIVTTRITDAIRYYNLTIDCNLYDSWMITGMALNLAYRIESGLVGVIDTETVLHSSATKMILDEELLVDLKSQLSAYSEDKALALKIIPTICYKTNYHLLWQLSQDCASLTYENNRDKDLQYWLDVSDFERFGRRSAQDMIHWLEQKEMLCRTTFRYLEPIVRREISINNRDLYTFKVSVKKEYQKYLKDEEKIYN